MAETATQRKLNVNIEVVPQPQIEEFMMFQDSDKLVEAIEKGEIPRLSVRMKTKTRVSVSIKGGDGSWNLNHSSDKFKMHTETGMSYATYKKVTNHYFVLSKKQNYAALLEYLKDSVSAALGHALTKDEITVYLNNSRDLQYIRIKYA